MRRLAAVLAAGALAPALGAAPARALDVGISDQRAASFDDARLRALGLHRARLVVPWDAATSEPDAVAHWLHAAAAAGMTPHVAFEHARGTNCPASPCSAPTRAQYGAAVRRFLARFPRVRTFTAWNEANHASQPTASSPETAAGYYDELRAACPACTLVAGDVVDSGTFVRWLQRFRAAVAGHPQLWGLHNYTDVTFGTTAGTDAVLAAVPGNLWIEETGGIVVRRDRAGRQLLAYDEGRAAAAVRQAFAIASTRPRIARLYMYQWNAWPQDVFDAGLVRPDGAERPSYDALVAALAALPRRAAATPGTTWTARWARPRTLVLRATCRPAGSRCSGTVGAVLRTLARGTHVARSRRLGGVRRYVTRGSTQVRIRVSAAVRRRARAAARRSIALTVRDAGRARRTVVLTLARPR